MFLPGNVLQLKLKLYVQSFAYCYDRGFVFVVALYNICILHIYMEYMLSGMLCFAYKQNIYLWCRLCIYMYANLVQPYRNSQSFRILII